MTQERLKLYGELEKELYESADRVAKYFVKFDESYAFINTWEYCREHTITGTGTETWAYGGFEDHYVKFDSKWLSATDEELQEYVDSVLKDLEEKEQKEQEEEDKKQKEKKYQEYLKLKKEFEDE